MYKMWSKFLMRHSAHSSSMCPNYALQRTTASHYCSSRRVSWPPSLSLGR